jgi:Secretion system C-terminal sorting domain/Domain of unknown function (DUF4397)
MKKITGYLVLCMIFMGINHTHSQARVQVIHNCADLAAATVDVYLNNVLLLDNFAFRTATPFIDAPSGVPISIQVKGPASNQAAPALYTLTTTLVPGSKYVLVADGIVSPTGYTPSNTTRPFQISVYNQGREAATSATKTDVLVHHGSTDAPTVDVNETSVPVVGLVNDISYPAFAGYLELATANYTLNVTPAAGSPIVASYSAPLQTLGLAGKAITVLASGFLNPAVNSNGPAFGLWVALNTGGPLVQLPAATTARVQVIHNCADLAAASVDVYLNNGAAPLLDNFAFRTASAFIDAPAGVPISIQVKEAASTQASPALYTLTTTLVPGSKYILVADGIVSPTGYTPSNVTKPFAINVYQTAREAATTSTKTDVLVHHGSTDAPTVDVNETSVPVVGLVNDISYPAFAGYLELATANYTLNVTPAAGSPIVASYSAPLQTLGLAGKAITVLASGFLNPAVNSNGPAFGLWVALNTGGPLVQLPAATTARVQVIHNCADLAAASVDVYLNNGAAPLLDNFAFRTASAFIDAPAGVPISIQVKEAASTQASPALYTLTTTLVPGSKYILVADGIVSPTGYTPSNVTKPFAINVYQTAREAATTSTKTDVLVHHGSTDAPTVDVNETSVPVVGLVNDISYPAFAGYLELATANYTLNVTPAAGSPVVASYSAPLQTLGLAGKAITVLASGFLNPANNSNGPAFGLWVALNTGGPLVQLPASTARVQVIHNCADLAATSVDVYLNNGATPLIDNFAFRTASAFIDAPAGVPISIQVKGPTSTTASPSLYTLTTTLVANSKYILVADGIVSTTGYTPSSATRPFQISVYNQAREAANVATKTDVLVHHGSTDAPTVDVNETTLPVVGLVNDISYPQFNPYLELNTANYILNVTPAAGSPVVATFGAPLQTLGLAGKAITVLASGFLTPASNSNGPAFGLWVALNTGGPLVPLPTGPLALQSFSSKNIGIYPNPVSNILTIDLPFTYEKANYSIVDLGGRSVQSADFTNQINVANLSNGLYIINLEVDNVNYAQKIVVNK